jgi:hypothetical protein
MAERAELHRSLELIRGATSLWSLSSTAWRAPCAT